MQKYRMSAGDRFFQIFVVVILIGAAVITIIPFLSVIAVSFSSKSALQQNAVTILPIGFTFDAWRCMLAKPDIWRAFGITVATTAFGTVLAVLVTALMAYPLSKKQFMLGHILMIAVIITMVFKAPIIPYFLTVRGVGLYNNILVLIVPHALTAYNLAVMRTFFRQLPVEIEESAMIDGCGPFRTLFRIVMPCSKAVLATVGLFAGVTIWNQYQHPLYFVSEPKLFPLQMKIRAFANEGIEVQALLTQGTVNYTERSLKAALVIIAIIPIIAVYPFLQKYFVKGAMLGSVKG